MSIENENENINQNENQNQNENNDNQKPEEKSTEKPNLFDGIEVEDNQGEEEEQENEFDYSKILGEEFEEEEKGKVDNLREKYKSENDLLKALYNANKLIGKRQEGAPEKYEFQKSEDLNFDINEDILEGFSELAKENGLNNEQYNNLVNNFAKQTNEIMEKAIEAEKENIKKEIDSIENFQTRAGSLLSKAKNLLSESEFKTLQNGVHSKEHFEVLEKLINSTKNSTIKPNINSELNKADAENKINDLTSKISSESNNQAREKLIAERRALIEKIQSGS